MPSYSNSSSSSSGIRMHPPLPAAPCLEHHWGQQPQQEQAPVVLVAATEALQHHQVQAAAQAGSLSHGLTAATQP